MAYQGIKKKMPRLQIVQKYNDRNGRSTVKLKKRSNQQVNNRRNSASKRAAKVPVDLMKSGKESSECEEDAKGVCMAGRTKSRAKNEQHIKH